MLEPIEDVRDWRDARRLVESGQRKQVAKASLAPGVARGDEATIKTSDQLVDARLIDEGMELFEPERELRLAQLVQQRLQRAAKTGHFVGAAHQLLGQLE